MRAGKRRLLDQPENARAKGAKRKEVECHVDDICGCVLFPSLLRLHKADLEEELRSDLHRLKQYSDCDRDDCASFWVPHGA